MGATVTTNKLASAFRAVDNQIYYILFEETYEKNVLPHTPRWSCIGIGILSVVLKRIFLYSSAVEGGSLQSRNGTFLPETYIASWIRELKNPVGFNDVDVKLEVGKSFSSPIQSDCSEAAYAVLSQRGKDDLVTHLKNGESVSVGLYAHAALLADLCDQSSVAAYSLFGGAPIYNIRRPDLGYTPAPGKKKPIELPDFLKIDTDNRLVQRSDGHWSNEGWEYRVVGNYIRTLWQLELESPGQYAKNIKAYRSALQAAPCIPAEMKVQIRTKAESSRQQKLVQEISEKFEVQDIPNGFQVTVTTDPILLRKLTALSADIATWVTPELPRMQYPMQLDLLAA